jgi:hypothetical protein
LYHDVHLKIFCIGDVLGDGLSNSLTLGFSPIIK